MTKLFNHKVWMIALAGSLFAMGTASADVKNVAGTVCERLSSSGAPESALYRSFYGKTCNSSSTQRLDLICPVVQDLGTGAKVTFVFDYEMWNLNGLNGNQNANPEQSFQCAAFSRTRYAQAYYWSGWKEAADVNGYGATPTALAGTVNKMEDNYFIHGVCYIPRKYDNKMSCISHMQYNEN